MYSSVWGSMQTQMSTITNTCIYFPVPQFERHVTRSSRSKLPEKKGKTPNDDKIMVTHVKPGPSPAKRGPSPSKPHLSHIKVTPKCKCKLVVVNEMQLYYKIKKFYKYNFLINAFVL